MYYLYILYAEKFDRYYVGQTNHLEKRFLRHNNGFVRSTKPFMPWQLVYSERYLTRKESMQREKQIKSMKSKNYIRELIEASR